MKATVLNSFLYMLIMGRTSRNKEKTNRNTIATKSVRTYNHSKVVKNTGRWNITDNHHNVMYVDMKCFFVSELIFHIYYFTHSYDLLIIQGQAFCMKICHDAVMFSVQLQLSVNVCASWVSS